MIQKRRCFSLGQGSFKMDCGKVENCSVVRTNQNLKFFLENWDPMSSGQKRTRTTQVVISAQFRSLHLWWYQSISVWYGNSSNQDCKALQRVVRLAERISGSTLPSLQGIYLKRCRSRAAKITKDSNHPGNHLFRLLPSGRRFRSLMAKTGTNSVP